MKLERVSALGYIWGRVLQLECTFAMGLAAVDRIEHGSCQLVDYCM